MAAILYSDGLIEFHYREISESSSWVSGLSMGDKTSYVIAQHSGTSQVPVNHFSEFTGGDFPKGISFSENGMLHGIPEAEGSWDLNFRVCDYDNIYADKELPFNVELNVSAPEQGVPFQVNVYPNPVREMLNIQFGEIPASRMRILLYDVNGKQSKRQYIVYNQQAGGTLSIPVDKFPAGIYLLRVVSEGYTATKKVLVE